MAVDLTRRGLIARGAAAAGALMGGSLLAPRLVFAGESGEAVVSMRLPASLRIEANRTFELVAIDGGAAEVRALAADGRWSEWLPLHPGRDHCPDATRSSGATAGRRLSDPAWTGPARTFEFRSARPLHGTRVVLVDAGEPGALATAKRYVAANLQAGPGQPPIIARSSWATSSCRPRVPAVFGEVELAFVHHTVSSNHYRRSQATAMVRSICLFHKYGNGWNDIGYNFVVDRHGQIFEGRAGGVDEAIVGAQAGGYNVYSSGVALLGTFTRGGPPRRTFDSLAKLLAWKLSLHGVPLPGRVTVAVTPDGSGYSRYGAGVPVDLDRIAGHRDADTTDCPGSGTYRQLPHLRKVAQSLAGTPSALSAAVTGVTPGSVSLSGQVTAADQPLVGVPIEIESRSTTRGPSTVGTATTNPDGTWTATVPLTVNAPLRAVYRGDATHAAVVSPGMFAAVPPSVTLTSATQQAPPGSVIQFSGSIAPPKAKLTLVVSQQQPDGSYSAVRTIRFAAAQDGTFTRSVGFPDAGQFQVIAQTAADAGNALGTSAPVTVTIA